MRDYPLRLRTQRRYYAGMGKGGAIFGGTARWVLGEAFWSLIFSWLQAAGLWPWLLGIPSAVAVAVWAMVRDWGPLAVVFFFVTLASFFWVGVGITWLLDRRRRAKALPPDDVGAVPVLQAFFEFGDKSASTEAASLATKMMEIRDQPGERRGYERMLERMWGILSSIQDKLVTGELSASAYLAPVNNNPARVAIPRDHWLFLRLDITDSSASGGGITYVGVRIKRSIQQDGQATKATNGAEAAQGSRA